MTGLFESNTRMCECENTLFHKCRFSSNSKREKRELVLMERADSAVAAG